MGAPLRRFCTPPCRQVETLWHNIHFQTFKVCTSWMLNLSHWHQTLEEVKVAKMRFLEKVKVHIVSWYFTILYCIQWYFIIWHKILYHMVQYCIKLLLQYIENDTWQNLYHTPYQPMTQRSTQGPRARGLTLVEGWFGCDTDFVVFIIYLKK